MEITTRSSAHGSHGSSPGHPNVDPIGGTARGIDPKSRRSSRTFLLISTGAPPGDMSTGSLLKHKAAVDHWGWVEPISRAKAC